MADWRWTICVCRLHIKQTSRDSIIMEYVSKIEVDGSLITLTDVLGDTKTVEGTIKMVDLTGGVVKINC